MLPNVALDLVGSLTEIVLGEERPSTLTSMNNLAGVLSDQRQVHAGGRDAPTDTQAQGDPVGQGEFIYADKHEQSGLTSLNSRTLRRGRATGGGSDGGKNKPARTGTHR